MSTDLEDSRQQALIFLMKAAVDQGIDLTSLVEATEESIAKHTAEPHSNQITKQIRIAQVMAQGVLTQHPAP